MVVTGLLPDAPVAGSLVVAAGVVWFGSGLLGSSAERRSAHYALGNVIRGPGVFELASVVVTALAGVFGVVVGSATFARLAVPGVSGLASDGGIDPNRAVVSGEARVCRPRLSNGATVTRGGGR